MTTESRLAVLDHIGAAGLTVVTVVWALVPGPQLATVPPVPTAGQPLVLIGGVILLGFGPAGLMRWWSAARTLIERASN